MAKLKYNINKKIDALPRTVTINKLLEILQKQVVSRSTFYADKAIELNSKTSIPTDRLLVYTKIFNCSIEDLLNVKSSTKSASKTAKPGNKVLKKVTSPLS